MTVPMIMMPVPKIVAPIPMTMGNDKDNNDDTDGDDTDNGDTSTGSHRQRMTTTTTNAFYLFQLRLAKSTT